MKKFLSILFSVILCGIACGTLIGCNTYIIPKNCCIVGLSNEFKLYSESEKKLCEPIDKKFKDVYESYDTNYYSVAKGADYTIIVDNFVDDRAGYGDGINGSFVSAWWQGFIITSFKKTFDEKSGLRDEEFFNTNFNQINCNVTVSFTENCTIKATYEQYLYVGGIFEVMPKGSNVSDNKIDEYLTENGILGERNGFYYLLLKDEVCVHHDAWKTNLEITDYKYEVIENGYNGIQAQFTTKAPAVTDNEELYLYTICRTYSGKYFVYPMVFIDAEGFDMPIREIGRASCRERVLSHV